MKIYDESPGDRVLTAICDAEIDPTRTGEASDIAATSRRDAVRVMDLLKVMRILKD